ncbi:MAG TPA: L-seryl-tRNA(Sec) selenium transferase, partial [Candidatus Methylomirabilis sp.]|nr:L-seryl-tRNA(Sec) selenium transferase [Candidatus Methylomirabilis sp.]
EPERALRDVPILGMLSLTAAAIGQRAERIARALLDAAPDISLTIEDETSEVGGGALPLQTIPTRVLACRPREGSAAEMEARLRRGRPPVLVRIKGDRVLVDLRTVEPADEAALLQALRQALGIRAGESP